MRAHSHTNRMLKLLRHHRTFPLRARSFSSRVHVHGASGRLGTAICQFPGTTPLAHRAVDPIKAKAGDVVVDTSLPAGLTALVRRLQAGADDNSSELPILLVGTTGELPVRDLEEYAARAPVYICPNFSTGVRLLMPALRTLGANPKFTTAVTEVHHTKKLDAPSGTAKILATALQAEQVSSIRAADIKGIHRMDVIGDLETIEITHTAHDRTLFAAGAVELAKELSDARAAGNLQNGLHDPFCMLPDTVDKVTTDQMSDQAPFSAPQTPPHDAPNTTATQMPKPRLQPTLATQKIQNLRLMTAIKTPYNSNGRIDLASFDRHVEHQIAHGVEALIIGGTTGEGHLLTWNEHIMLIAHTKNKFGDKITVVGNTGSNSTGELNRCSAYGFAAGMDAALVINPYYGKTSVEGIIKHIEVGMQYGPSIVYNVPSRTGQDILPEVMARLAEHPHFAGVKECQGPDRIREYVQAGLTVWSGNDDDMHFCRHVLGAQGSISVLSNVVPGLYRDLLFGPRNDELNASLSRLNGWLFEEPNPAGVNTLLMQLGVSKPNFRLPYLPLSKSKRREIVEIVRDIGPQHVINGDNLNVLEDDEFSIIADY